MDGEPSPASAREDDALTLAIHVRRSIRKDRRLKPVRHHGRVADDTDANVIRDDIRELHALALPARPCRLVC